MLRAERGQRTELVQERPALRDILHENLKKGYARRSWAGNGLGRGFDSPRLHQSLPLRSSRFPKALLGITIAVELVQSWMPAHPIAQGLVAGFFIVLMNLVGALIVLLTPKPSERVMDALLGFAAGVMLTASFTSLILPGIELGGIFPVIAGLALGTLAMDAADHLVPHHHVFIGREGCEGRRIRAVVLFVIAITLHNAPEGLAVGVTFGGGNFREGVLLMLAIGAQNVPEGLAVAVAALAAGFGKRFYAAFVGIRSGLIELPMAVLGAALVYYIAPLVPYAMGFAAGAMLYVISDEIVPETHRKGHERWATFGLMIGLITMLYLDVVLH